MKKLLLLLSILMTATVSTPAQQAPAQVTPTNPAGNCVDLPSLEKKVEDMNDRLKDWPQLARYREANTTLKPPTKDEPRVVFMGDSITDIWQYPQFGGFFPGKPYIDRGIGGQTTPQMLLRFPGRHRVAAAGCGDSCRDQRIAGNTGPMTLEETEGHLASMSELAHAHGIRVVLASVTPVNDITTLEGKKITQTTRRPPKRSFP